jgi:hypothetical protein
MVPAATRSTHLAVFMPFFAAFLTSTWHIDTPSYI